MDGAWAVYYHSLDFTRIQFQPLEVTPLTNLAEVTDQGLCYRNSNAWGWHNSYQSGVFGITNQLILQNGEKLRGVQNRKNITSPKHCPVDSVKLYSLLNKRYSLFRQPSTITYCDRFDRNCVNTEKKSKRNERYCSYQEKPKILLQIRNDQSWNWTSLGWRGEPGTKRQKNEQTTEWTIQ